MTSILGRHADRALLAGSLLIWLPALLFGIALAVGGLAGCELSEADVRPCVIAGVDLGLPLTLMAIMGWLVIALSPFMALTLGLGILWSAVRIARTVWRVLRARRGRS